MTAKTERFLDGRRDLHLSSSREPRVEHYVPNEESFPIPLEYIDVVRRTNTTLEVLQESRIDDHWNVDGGQDLSEPLTGFTQFTTLSEKPPWTCCRYTRRRFECTRGDVLNVHMEVCRNPLSGFSKFFPACRTTHTVHQTHTTTTCNTTPHRPHHRHHMHSHTQHNIIRRQKQRETEKRR